MPHGITQCYLPPGRGDIPVCVYWLELEQLTTQPVCECVSRVAVCCGVSVCAGELQPRRFTDCVQQLRRTLVSPSLVISRDDQ